jgi:hypothetical protein
MADSINFSFDNFEAKPVDDLEQSYQHYGPGVVGHPAQSADSDEYICGHSGNAHPYANAGRDQDRSRVDECIPAQGCSRYVS